MVCLRLLNKFNEVIVIAFGISKRELSEWKLKVERGEIAYLTHYWYDERFPNCKTVTKVGCANLDTLEQWCKTHALDPQYIHRRGKYPHFDLLGPYQRVLLKKLGLIEHVERFQLDNVNFTDRW